MSDLNQSINQRITNMSTVTINGVDYEPVTKSSDIRIVVLQRGWVLIGRYREDGDEVTMSDASIIRVWGTTQGLGELHFGPTPSTKLDKTTGAVRAHRGAVVLTVDVDDETWEPML